MLYELVNHPFVAHFMHILHLWCISQSQQCIYFKRKFWIVLYVKVTEYIRVTVYVISAKEDKICEFLFASLQVISANEDKLCEFLFASLHVISANEDKVCEFLFASLHVISAKGDKLCKFLCASLHIISAKEDKILWIPVCFFARHFRKGGHNFVNSCLLPCTSFPPRETNFVNSCLIFRTPNVLLKRVYSNRKEFAPMGSKFFPFRADPFSEKR